jgi:hypothetical protein
LIKYYDRLYKDDEENKYDLEEQDYISTTFGQPQAVMHEK